MTKADENLSNNLSFTEHKVYIIHIFINTEAEALYIYIIYYNDLYNGKRIYINDIRGSIT